MPSVPITPLKEGRTTFPTASHAWKYWCRVTHPTVSVSTSSWNSDSLSMDYAATHQKMDAKTVLINSRAITSEFKGCFKFCMNAIDSKPEISHRNSFDAKQWGSITVFMEHTILNVWNVITQISRTRCRNCVSIFSRMSCSEYFDGILSLSSSGLHAIIDNIFCVAHMIQIVLGWNR